MRKKYKPELSQQNCTCTTSIALQCCIQKSSEFRVELKFLCITQPILTDCNLPFSNNFDSLPVRALPLMNAVTLDLRLFAMQVIPSALCTTYTVHPHTVLYVLCTYNRCNKNLIVPLQYCQLFLLRWTPLGQALHVSVCLREMSALQRVK